MTRISPWGWTGIGVVLLAPWIVLLWMYARVPPPAPIADTPPASARAAVAPKSPRDSSGLRVGPWGKLSYLRITIEPPEEFIPTDYVPPTSRWTFKNMTPADLENLWERAALPAEQRAVLRDPARRTVSGPAIVIEPPAELVRNLTPAARGQIYTALAAFPENATQREPFRFRSEMIDEWFDGSGVPPHFIQLTRELCYTRNRSIFFSDYDLVLPQMSSAGERALYLKTLARKSALLVSLHVDRDTDIDAASRYWGRGRRAKDVKPLLQSLARRPEARTIDIVHLVPRFPRSLLYTYPLPSDDPNDANRDCHWTSFNFYRDIPDDRFTDIEFVKQTLQNEYYPVAGEPRLGDIIMFVQPGGVVIHSCVHIADDIVFTKNGPSFAVPWQFAELDSVLSFYSVGPEPLEVRRYRSRHE